jgi:hypothetical protein
MENWKRALVAGSAVTGLVLLLKGRESAGMFVAGVGVALWASEEPERFARLRKDARSYTAKGMTFLEVTSRLGERIAEVSDRRSGSEWYERLLAS